MVVSEVSGCIAAEANRLRKVTGFDYKSGYRRWKTSPQRLSQKGSLFGFMRGQKKEEAEAFLI